MKIWCQSCGSFGQDPVWDDYEQCLNKRAKEVARPDTYIELHGLDAPVPAIDTYNASRNMCTIQSTRNAIRAEREGFDAFVMISLIDAGFYEIREVTDLPVVFMLENCIHFALMLAPKFSFLTHNKSLLLRMTELTNQYGLDKNLIPGGYLDLSYSVWPDMYKHPEHHVDKIVQKAKELIANGAGIIIPSALPLDVWLVQQGLTEIDGACVLDAFGCAIKMAELMVDLKKVGISRSKVGPPSKEMLENIQKLYIP